MGGRDAKKQGTETIHSVVGAVPTSSTHLLNLGDNKKLTNKIIGTAYWCKLLGKPHEGYDPDKKEWSIDVAPNPEGVSLLQNLGLGDKLKDDEKNSHDGQRFIVFKRLELKRLSGEPNNPVQVENSYGDPWDRDVSIGNGSKIEVTFNVYDIPAKGRLPAGRGVAILKVKVLDCVPYERPDEAVVKAEPAEIVSKAGRRKVDSSKEEAFA